jgi:hypothetical protein
MILSYSIMFIFSLFNFHLHTEMSASLSDQARALFFCIGRLKHNTGVQKKQRQVTPPNPAGDKDMPLGTFNKSIFIR